MLLDHSDFQKSRRALIISSIILYLITHVKLTSSEMEIFKLKFPIDQSVLITYWKILTTYFFFVFVVEFFFYKGISESKRFQAVSRLAAGSPSYKQLKRIGIAKLYGIDFGAPFLIYVLVTGGFYWELIFGDLIPKMF